MADSVGLALLVVLDTLSPAERVAFVLHDLFDLPFDEIAPIVGRTPEAARQLASRARRRVRGTTPDADPARQRRVVNAFLAASRGGDFTALMALLDPDVVLRADAEAVRMGVASDPWCGGRGRDVLRARAPHGRRSWAEFPASRGSSVARRGWRSASRSRTGRSPRSS